MDQNRAGIAFGNMLGAVVAGLLLCGPPAAHAVVVTDDFSDMNDTANPIWVHLDGYVNSTGQTWDASTGQYRLHAPSNAVVPIASILDGSGFVGSYVEPVFTDVRVTADIVDFVEPGFVSSYFAVGARLNGNDDPPILDSGIQLRGYSYQYEGTARQGAGEMVLTILHGYLSKDIGSFPLTLESSKDYRVVFEVVGNTLHGQVFELDASGGIVAMLADQFRDLDANPPSPENYDGSPDASEEPFDPSQYASGFAGVYGFGSIIAADADFTIDNFRAESIGGLTGDYNENGAVDAADYAVWRNNAGTTNTLPNDDLGGTIGQGQYDQWRANYGSSAGSGFGNGGAVPEPAAAVQIFLGWACLSSGRRRFG